MPGRSDAEAFGRSFWPEQATPPGALPILAGRIDADVAVIGAGYTGLSAALHLGRQRDVVVLEAEAPGFGSSGRNAAGYLPVYLDRTPDDVVRALGRDRGDALNRMVAGSTDLVLDIVARHGIPADVRPTGIFMGGSNAGAPARLRALAAMWRRYGSTVRMLDTAETERIAGTSKFHGGLYFPGGGTLNPVSYARGLADAALAGGARLFGRTAARRLARTGDRWTIKTDAGEVTARHVLIATDAYPAVEALWPALRDTYYSVPIAVLVSRPMPDRIRRLMPAGIPISDTHKSNHLWMAETPDGRLVTSMLPPRRDDMGAAAVARPWEKKLRRLYGDLAPIDWHRFWIGRIGITAKRLPCAFDLADGLHAIGGYCGQGITTATAAGREYARFVLADGDRARCDLPFLPPQRVPMRTAFPVLLRHVLAPLARATDRAYA